LAEVGHPIILARKAGMGEESVSSFADAFVAPGVWAVAVALRCHPEPIRAKREWVRDLLLLSLFTLLM
jgi:hypothetical protein